MIRKLLQEVCDLSESAALSAISNANLNRPTRLLSSEDAETVREVYRLLGDPAVQGNRALQTALRRLVFSGSRSLPKDRLVDLMTGAEALFIKHAGIRNRSKGVHVAEKSRLEAPPAAPAGSIALLAPDRRITVVSQKRNTTCQGQPCRHQPGACALLGGDLVVGANPNTIRQFMENAYRLRNDEMHGDDLTLRSLTRLDESETGTLSVVIEDIERDEARNSPCFR